MEAMPNHLDNLFNPAMNNIEAIDYSDFDLHNGDGVLPRYS